MPNPDQYSKTTWGTKTVMLWVMFPPGITTAIPGWGEHIHINCREPQRKFRLQHSELPLGLLGGHGGHVLDLTQNSLQMFLSSGSFQVFQHLLSVSPWFYIAGLFLGPCGSKIKAKELGDLKERVPSIVV